MAVKMAVEAERDHMGSSMEEKYTCNGQCLSSCVLYLKLVMNLILDWSFDFRMVWASSCLVTVMGQDF